MKTCNQYSKQIVQYDDLSVAEKEQLRKHANSCQACNKQFRETIAIQTALSKFRTAGHLEDEVLTRYGIYLADAKAPDYDGGKLSKKEIAGIKNHIKQCHHCRMKVERIQQEFQEVETYLEKEGVPDTLVGVRPAAFDSSASMVNFSRKLVESIRGFLFPVQKRSSPASMMPAAVMTFAALFIAVWISPLFRGGSGVIYNLARLEKTQTAHVTRSLGSQLINEGFSAFNHGDYKQAIVLLEKYLQTNSTAATLALVHNQIGMAYLCDAEDSFFGRFKHFDTEKVDRGINHLQQTLRLTKNTRLLEDAQWYLGKAYLMKNEIGMAKTAFAAIPGLNGYRAEQAKTMLADLEKF